MVDALKDVNPELYNIAVQTKNQGLAKIAMLQKQMGNQRD